jgi:hypothetical protein
MSIDRQYGFLIISCDDCEHTFMGNKADDFDAVWSAARDEGWKARKVVNEWMHFCGQPCEPGESK